MDRKNKNYFFIFFVLPAFLVGFFIFSRLTFADSTLKLGNIQYTGGPGKTHEDYIEIINVSESIANLDGYRLAKKTSASSNVTSIKSWTSDTFISPGGKHLWANSENDFSKKINADSSTAETITEGNGIALILGSADDGTIIDSVNWKEDDQDEDEDDDEDEEENDYTGKVKINEIYPSPSDKCPPIDGTVYDKEFIELIILTEDAIDFSQWYIKDENEYKKDRKGYGKNIGQGKKDGQLYLKEASFSLNSEGDTVYLYDKNDHMIDKTSYKSAKTCYSYSFEGSTWRWTSKVTPNAKNNFDKLLLGKIKMDSEIFANMYAQFDVKADSDAQKFTWNFGDGHKSYLKNTQHKYEHAGTYEASLKISGNGEDNLYTFTVKVKNYDAPKIKIVSIVPNPKGKDSGEYIMIKNESKEKVNLKNWSIATGWENLYNHPIREDFELKKGKSKKLKKKICAYTLNNTKTKIELRDPTGEVVQKIKYDRTKNKIEEDEIFELSGKDWQWNAPPNNSPDEKSSESPPLPSGEDVPSDGTGEGSTENTGDIIIIPESEIQAGIGKSTIDPVWQNNRKNQIVLLSYSTQIKTPEIILDHTPRVLGIADEKISPEEKHWAVYFLDKITRKINFSLNWVLNKI